MNDEASGGTIALLRQGERGQPALATALSHALLRRVAAGELPTTVRLYRPDPTLALSRLDRLRPGYDAAASRARAHGYEPVLRLAGGRAAAYDEDSLIYEEIVSASLVYGVQERFVRVTEDIRLALSDLGFDARVGELPGEYCPGAHSLNLAGRAKVAGVAQRAIQGAAIVSAVVIVAGEARLRVVLRAVYDALEYDWDARTVGSLAGGRRDIGVEDVERALVSRLRRRGEVIETAIDRATTVLASALEGGHAVPPALHDRPAR